MCQIHADTSRMYFSTKKVAHDKSLFYSNDPKKNLDVSSYCERFFYAGTATMFTFIEVLFNWH